MYLCMFESQTELPSDSIKIVLATGYQELKLGTTPMGRMLIK